MLALGFVVDLTVLGGGRVHALAWALAAVVVVGSDAISIYAARSLRSVEITEDELRVGEDAVPLSEIVAVVGTDADADTGAAAGPVLGRRPGEGLPRGTAAVALELTGGRRVRIASRRPQQLGAALGAALGAGAPPSPVRPAAADDLDLLPGIDRRAGTLFRVAGLSLPDAPLAVDELRRAPAVLVAGHPPVGFVQLGVVDGAAHVQELAVLPAHMRRGVGTALLEAACEWARSQGHPAITLTTFADVAWNAPFYRRRGFAELADLTPGLAAIRAGERESGLDRAGRRIAMRRDLRGPARGAG